jgi:hypothetical protein
MFVTTLKPLSTTFIFMEPSIGKTLSEEDKSKYQFCSNYGSYEIYLLEEDISFLVAINKENLVCGCFEFQELYEGLQLAHMYALEKLKG